jgi:hypothetical protein
LAVLNRQGTRLDEGPDHRVLRLDERARPSVATQSRASSGGTDCAVTRFKCPDHMSARQQLLGGEASAAQSIDRFHEILAIAPGDRIADIDDQRLCGERFAVILADLLDRGIGHDEEHDIAEGYGLLHRTGFRQRSGTGDEIVQLFGVARRKHDRVTRLSESGAERAAFAAGADHADLERHASGHEMGGRRLRQRGKRRSRKDGEHGRAGHHAKKGTAASSDDGSVATGDSFESSAVAVILPDNERDDLGAILSQGDTGAQ